MQKKCLHLEMQQLKNVRTIQFHFFSDLTRKVTLQNLYHDGGFSNVGVSQDVIDFFT